MGTFLVLLGVLAIICLVCRSILKDRKKGTLGPCGGNCSKCHGSCH